MKMKKIVFYSIKIPESDFSHQMDKDFIPKDSSPGKET